MKRLLCIVGGMNVGGAETFLMKIYRNLNKKEYQMDFAVAVKGKYDDEINAMGGKIFYITPKSKGFFKNFISIVKLVKDNKYNYVLRVSQNSLSAVELLAARIGGAKNVALRSSNSKTIGGLIDSMTHIICKPLAILIPNIKIAPSDKAATFMFGNSKKTIIIKNGLDIKEFRFSSSEREKYRKELNICDKTLFVHIGRFNQQKNHVFLIKVFNEIHKKKADARLALIGTGELKESIEKIVKEYSLEDCVKFLGVRNDVSKLLSAMDCMIFPSFYEGMPNVLIEAQANGLPCVISDTITKDVKITSLINVLSLNANAEIWAETALNHIRDTKLSEKAANIVRESGYDISDCSKSFCETLF